MMAMSGARVSDSSVLICTGRSSTTLEAVFRTMRWRCISSTNQAIQMRAPYGQVSIVTIKAAVVIQAPKTVHESTVLTKKSKHIEKNIKASGPGIAVKPHVIGSVNATMAAMSADERPASRQVAAKTNMIPKEVATPAANDSANDASSNISLPSAVHSACPGIRPSRIAVLRSGLSSACAATRSTSNGKSQPMIVGRRQQTVSATVGKRRRVKVSLRVRKRSTRQG